jgi:hypothetical protein
MESNIGPGRSAAANVEAVLTAFRTAGIIFLSTDDVAGPGVRLKK